MSIETVCHDNLLQSISDVKTRQMSPASTTVLHVLPFFLGFLPRSKDMQVNRDSKLPVGVTVSLNG